MRQVELARAAAQAEALYLRRAAQRQAVRGVFGAVAAVFGIAVLVMLHVLAFLVLLIWVSPLIAAVILLALDIVVAIIFALMARQNTPGAIEQEAKVLRDQTLTELRSSMTLMSLAASATGLAVRRGARVRTGGSTGRRLAGAVVSRLMTRGR